MSAPTTVDGVLDAEARAALQRRTLAVVVVSQVFGGAGLAAGITVGALLAQEMLGGEGVAGLPTALFTLGSALAAFSVGRLTQRAGRRLGLALGFGNLTHYIARALLEAGGFRPRLHPRL